MQAEKRSLFNPTPPPRFFNLGEAASIEQCPICQGPVEHKCRECVNPCRWCALGHCWCSCVIHATRRIRLAVPMAHGRPDHRAINDRLSRECTCESAASVPSRVTIIEGDDDDDDDRPRPRKRQRVGRPEERLNPDDVRQFYDALKEFRGLADELMSLLCKDCPYVQDE